MKNKIINRVAFIATLFLGLVSFAQEKTTSNVKPPFEVFNSYSNFGFSISPRVQFQSKSNNTLGSNPFVHNNSFAGGVGIHYIFKPENTWSYRIGLNYNYATESNFNLKDDPRNISFKSTFNAVSVPLEIEYKKQISKNFIWSVKTGVNIAFIQDFDTAVIDYEGFNLSYEPNSNLIYPNFIISTGTYFVFKPFILQTNIIFQKGIPTLNSGEYNVLNAQNLIESSGTYDMTGDYLGLEFIINFKKQSKN